MEVSKEIVKDLAENIETGLKVFFNKNTFEVVTYLDPEENPGMEEEFWQEEINKVEKDKDNFIEIERMDSRSGFAVMEEFIDSLEENITKVRLQVALEGKKPFANFKHQIDNSGEYRQLWFAFKLQKDIEWVQNQLRLV